MPPDIGRGRPTWAASTVPTPTETDDSLLLEGLAEACLVSRRGIAEAVIHGRRMLAVADRQHTHAGIRDGLKLQRADGRTVHLFEVA